MIDVTSCEMVAVDGKKKNGSGAENLQGRRKKWKKLGRDRDSKEKEASGKRGGMCLS